MTSTERRKRNQGFGLPNQVAYLWKTLVSSPLVYLRRCVLDQTRLIKVTQGADADQQPTGQKNRDHPTD